VASLIFAGKFQHIKDNTIRLIKQTKNRTKIVQFIEQFAIFVAQNYFIMAIGNQIRKLRIAKNLSQQVVADNLNIDRRTYAAWEQGTQDVKSSFIPRLAEFFGVEISDLFTNETNINIKQSFKDNNSSINTAILILTDKEIIERVLDAAVRPKE
jgi:transcriptional regulator with XRE-family HTH domain